MNTTKSVTTKEDNNVKYFACNSTITRGKGTCYTTEASIYYLQYILIRKKHSERKKRNDDKERDIH